MSRSDRMLHINKIAIVGSPNVGKSSLFNQLTKDYSLVANLPYTTVSIYRSTVQIEGTAYEIIDTPGIMSLDMESEEGLATRAVLMEEHPEIIILCMDSNNIQRSLLLASQIIDMNIPMIMCLNFVDEALHKGITIGRKKLEKIFGVPVVETVANEGRGIKSLLKAIPKAAVPMDAQIRYKQFIEKGLDGLSACFPADAVPPDGILLMFMVGVHGTERFIKTKYGPEILKKAKDAVARIQTRTGKDMGRMILEGRTRWAEKMAREIMETRVSSSGRFGATLGMLCRHPLWGWLVLLGVMYVTYLLVGKVGINILVPFFEQDIFAPVNNKIGELIAWDFGRDFLIGRYGILTTGFENAVGTVLPILTMFFIVLNCLEDTGYIANLCVLSNRLFQHLGLSGKAILPIVLGFGCRTMATLTTRILESRKERIIAIFLISFAIPCAPLLGVTLAVLALLPFTAFLTVFGVLVCAEVLAGIAMNKLLTKDIMPDFIMEIPPVRLPNLKNLIIKTYYRMKWFTIEAIPLFMLGSFLLFVIDTCELLHLIRHAISPIVVTFLGLPLTMVDAFLLCLLRLEAGAVVVMRLAQAHELDQVQTVVSLIVMTGFVPCFANTIAIVKELGIRIAVLMVLAITTGAFIIGGIVNFILRMI